MTHHACEHIDHQRSTACRYCPESEPMRILTRIDCHTVDMATMMQALMNRAQHNPAFAWHRYGTVIELD